MMAARRITTTPMTIPAVAPLESLSWSGSGGTPAGTSADSVGDGVAVEVDSVELSEVVVDVGGSVSEDSLLASEDEGAGGSGLSDGRPSSTESVVRGSAVFVVGGHIPVSSDHSLLVILLRKGSVISSEVILVRNGVSFVSDLALTANRSPQLSEEISVAVAVVCGSSLELSSFGTTLVMAMMTAFSSSMSTSTDSLVLH
jgi:hypothetical protein